jgi:hypothetical protein
MSSDKALVPVESLGGELISADQDLLQELTVGGGFLPYVQLFTSNSDPVKEDKIRQGHYGLVQDGNIIDLGKDTTFVVFTARARAFRKESDGAITVSYDKKDPVYVEIGALQGTGVQGCMAGPEILIWVPSQKTFATFFCGSKTLKRASRKFKPFLGGKACRMRSELIDNGKHKWHGPIITVCSTPPTDLPTSEDAEDQVEKFKNPPKPKPPAEKAEEGEQEDVER